jgi:hypothetical protein
MFLTFAPHKPSKFCPRTFKFVKQTKLFLTSEIVQKSFIFFEVMVIFGCRNEVYRFWQHGKDIAKQGIGVQEP